MPIISNNYIYEAVSETVTKPAVAHRANLEFLTACGSNCRGCFVDRNNPSYTQDDLDLLETIINSVNESGAIFDELVFGPVDFFGATNSIQLLKEPKLQHIMAKYKPIFAIPTTLCFDDEVYLNFVEIFNKYYPHEYLEFELQIVPNPKKVLANDREYIDTLKRRIEIFDGMIAHVCYTMAMNVQSLKNIDIHEYSLIIKKEFDTIIDFVPSFFRKSNKKTTKKMLNLWNKDMERQINQSNKNDIQLVIADWTHGGFNYTNWVIAQGNIYLSPFIHENVADITPQFRVPKEKDRYTVNDLNAAIQKSRELQFNYVDQTEECSTCKYLDVCIARHVLYYMKQYNFKHCLMPKKVLDLFTRNMGEMAKNIYDWSDYTTTGEIEHGNKKHHEFAKRKGLI